MSSQGVTSINELPNPNSNVQNNSIQQQLLMQQQPQNIVLNKNEIVSTSNNQMPGAAMGQILPNGDQTMQNPISQMQNNNPQVTMENSIQNQQPNYNELVSQIQKASLNGSTTLPSRDIPIDPTRVANDNEIKPNYIPPPPQQMQENYIKNNETPQHLIEENNRNTEINNTFDMLFNELQLPIIIALLYFLFQLPAIKKYSKAMMPFLFKEDGNPNLYGYVVNSIMFASMVYVLLKAVSKLV